MSLHFEQKRIAAIDLSVVPREKLEEVVREAIWDAYNDFDGVTHDYESMLGFVL